MMQPLYQDRANPTAHWGFRIRFFTAKARPDDCLRRTARVCYRSVRRLKTEIPAKVASLSFSARRVILCALFISLAAPVIPAQATLTCCAESDPYAGPRSSAVSPPACPQADKARQVREVLGQAEADLKAGRLEEALRKCRQAIDLNPQAADAYYLLGIIQDRRGAREEAGQDMLLSLKLDPSLTAAHAYLGRMYLRSSELDQARAEFQAAIRLGDNASADAHYGLGLALNAESKYEEALPNLRAAVEVRPADASRLFALGQCEVELARREDVRNLEQIESLPEGRTTVPNDRYLAAITYLEKALAASPSEDFSRSVQMDLAVAYSHSGRDNEAAAMFQKQLKFWPQSSQLHFNLGVVYGHLQRYSEAVAEFQQTLKLKPDDDNARLAIAHVYLSYGQFKDAIPHLQSYIQHKPNYAHAYQLLGRAYRRQGQYSEAVAVLRKGVQLDPESYEARFDLGASLARLGEIDQAIEQLQEAKKLKPDGSEAAYELGLLLMKKNAQPAARDELEQFGQLKEQTDQRMRAGVPNNQGNDLMQQGRVREAVAAYQEATKMDPGNAPFHYNLALALAKLGDHQGEQRALQDAIIADPRFAKAHTQLGLSYMADGRLPDAEAEFKKALDINPEFAEAENNLGVLYSRVGKNDDAMRFFQKATEDSPQYVDALANLGLALAEQGKYDEARRQLQRAIAASPEYPAAYNALGLIAETTGRDEEAFQLLKKAVELQPNSPEAHLNLGNALANGFNLVGALKEFSEAARLAPNSALAHYNKGRLLYDSRQLQEATAELEIAFRLSPEDPSALYVFALAEAQMNNFSRATELLNRLVHLDPRDSDAQYLLGQMMLRLGKTQEAIKHWQISVDANPNSLKVLHDLADLLSKVESPEANLYAARFDALQKRQRLTDPVLQLDRFGMEAAKAHNWPEAVVQLKEALRLCGNCAQSADLHRDLGVILCHQGETENGEGELRVAVELKPNDAVALKTLQVLGTVKNRLGNYH